MDWLVIGTGRLGSTLLRWLNSSGVPAQAVSHRDLESWLRRLPNVRPSCLFLAIPDDALPVLALRLARARRDWRGWRILHGSGTQPASVLAPLSRRGASIASMHPMMTFTRQPPMAAGWRSPERRRADSAGNRNPHSKRTTGATRTKSGEPPPRGVVFSLEGEPAACRAARTLVRRWGGQPLALTPRAKAAYHLAATMVGPGAVVNFGAAEAILARAGLSGPNLRRARAGLSRLLRTTAGNLERSTAAAWTGPWARADRTTIAIQQRRMPTKTLHNLYQALTSASKLVATGSKKKR